MDARHIWSGRWRIIGAIGMVLVVMLTAGIFIVRQRQLAAQASTPAGVCGAPPGNALVVTVGPTPLGLNPPVTLPKGEPRIVATVNGDPLYAEELEARVAETLANNQRVLQQAGQQQPGLLPPNMLASLKETPNQVRHDALTRMIQECLLLQEGKRLGLSASLAAAQGMARQQLQLIHSLHATDPVRVSFETYLHENRLTEQTFITDPRILHTYMVVLTLAAVRQHILKGLPADESPEAGINAYTQHLWQTGDVRVFLPAQLGW